MQVSEFDLPFTGAKVDLALTLACVGDSVSGSLVYNSDLFNRSTIERISEQLQDLLTAVSIDLDQPLSTLVSAMDSKRVSAITLTFSDRLQSLEV